MGISILEICVGYYYTVLKDGSWIVDRGPTYTERLFGAAMKNTDKTWFVVLRCLKAISLCFFSYFYGLARFVVFSYPVRLHFTCFTLINCDSLITLSHSL